MTTFNRHSYPLPPSLDNEDDQAPDLHKEASATPIVVQSKGQAPTPQQLVVLQATASKLERDRRLRAAQGLPDSALFAPHSSTDAAFNVKKGFLGICHLTPGHTYRGALQADQGANVQVFCNMGGLRRDTKLGIPCVVQVNRDATNLNSEDRTTLVVDGVQQIFAGLSFKSHTWIGLAVVCVQRR